MPPVNASYLHERLRQRFVTGLSGGSSMSAPFGELATDADVTRILHRWPAALGPKAVLYGRRSQANGPNLPSCKPGQSRGPAALLPRPRQRRAGLLLAGEGEALTRKAVELALAGDPAAQVAVTLRGAMQLGHVIGGLCRRSKQPSSSGACKAPASMRWASRRGGARTCYRLDRSRASFETAAVAASSR